MIAALAKKGEEELPVQVGGPHKPASPPLPFLACCGLLLRPPLAADTPCPLNCGCIFFARSTPLSPSVPSPSLAPSLPPLGGLFPSPACPPPQFICATQKDEFRKPEPGMWQFFAQHMNGGVQPDLG